MGFYGGFDPFGYGYGGGYGGFGGFGGFGGGGYPALYGAGSLGYPGMPMAGVQGSEGHKDGFDDQLMGRKKSDFGVFMTVAGITAVGLASIVAFRRTADRHFPRIVYPKPKPQSSSPYGHNHSGYHSAPQPYRPAPTCAESGWHTHPPVSYEDRPRFTPYHLREDRFDIARKAVEAERARVKKLERAAKEKAQRNELPAATPTRPSEMPAAPIAQLATIHNPIALYNFVKTRNNKPNPELKSSQSSELPAGSAANTSPSAPKNPKKEEFSYDPWVLAGQHVKAEVERVQTLQELAGGKPALSASELAATEKSTHPAELETNLTSPKRAILAAGASK